MMGLIICFGILPFMYGSILLTGIEKNTVLRISVGFMLELVCWTISYVPIYYLNQKLSTSVVIFAWLSILCFILTFRRIVNLNHIKSTNGIKIKGKATDFVVGLRDLVLYRAFGIMLLFILFQALRAVFFQYGYGDNRIYVAMVNDMVTTDKFYPYVDETGALWGDYAVAPKKYMLSSWYTFEAMLSKVTGIKPLILIYTILPAVIIIMMYVIGWELSGIFFKDRINERSLFIIAFAVLTELYTADVSDYILCWPTYGKNITASIVMPLFLLIWLYNRKERQWNYEVLLFLMMIAGCAASTMGLMMMPLEAGLLSVVEVIKNKKLERSMVYRFLLLMVPVLIYAYLFIR